jgi:pseudouridine synthase
MQVRLHKFIADAGIASRRAAERLMREGRVLVNGVPALEPGVKVHPTADAVTVDGRPIQVRARRTVALNKPVGYVCSKARQTPKQRLVTDCLPAAWSDLYPVGRLDRESEGLLLLTNDGEFCLRLTHPRYGVVKKYVAGVIGKLGLANLDQLRAGVTDRGEVLRPQRVRLLSANASHSVVELDLTEGKQHEVRRLFAALGFAVERLQRVQIGPVKLGELPPGRWRVLAPAEIEALRRSTSHAAPRAPAVDTAAPAPSTRAKR